MQLCQFLCDFWFASLLKLFKRVFNVYCIMMEWRMWLYRSSSDIFRVFCPCSCGCDFCCEFYPLGWGLSWSLVSWFCLGSYQSTLLLCLLPIQIFSPFNSFPIHNFILLLCQVCIYLFNCVISVTTILVITITVLILFIRFLIHMGPRCRVGWLNDGGGSVAIIKHS